MDNELGEEQFARIALFIEGNYGIRIPPEKRVMIQSRLAKRVRDLGFRTINDYIGHVLDNDEADDEVSKLVDLISTHMTSFFREASHFDLLLRKILPELCASHDFDRANPLVAWSAACSTGEEAYSLALVLEQYRREGRGPAKRFEYAVLGTDLARGILAEATKGIYPESVLDGIPPAFQSGYFLKSRTATPSKLRIAPEIRSRVFFRHLNLMQQPYDIKNRVHVIFCRNVLIYFDRMHQMQVIAALSRTLEPGGFLVLGHAESIIRPGHNLRQYAPTVYRKQFMPPHGET